VVMLLEQHPLPSREDPLPAARPATESDALAESKVSKP